MLNRTATLLTAGLIAGAALCPLAVGAEAASPRIGFRAGILRPMSERGTDYRDAPVVGLFRAAPLGRRLTFEMLIDVSEVTAVSDTSSAELYAVRLHLVVGRLGQSRGIHPYLVLGGGAIHADVDGPAYDSETVGSAEAGVGVFARGWDGRLLYSSAVGSENARGVASVTIGRRF